VNVSQLALLLFMRWAGVVGTSLRYRDLTLKDVHTEIEEIRSWLADE
jgi:hypothetical protein